ncbi:MAG: NTP transferase domain-containing protein [Limnochordales bacterium]|nr:NTP transferase domain-containing protein [Limnochordales bacterium]
MATDSQAAVTAVVLAAGLSKRMKSQKIKVLHHLCGRPAILHLIDSLERAGFHRILLVVGHQQEEVKHVVGERAEYVVQEQLLGTGDAVRQAAARLLPEETVLITYGDTVLYRPETFRRLVEFHLQSGAAATLLSTRLSDPTGYGRVIRKADGSFARIVEEKDASPVEREINEINTGTYCFAGEALQAALPHLQARNAQGEYYLTDTLGWLREQGRHVAVLELDDPDEALGFNDRRQLAQAERVLRDRIRSRLMESGVTLVDPNNIYIDPDVEIEADTVVEPGTWLVGRTRVGRGCHIGPWVYLEDATVAPGTRLAFCYQRGDGRPVPLVQPLAPRDIE